MEHQISWSLKIESVLSKHDLRRAFESCDERSSNAEIA